jgi:hypothetical protein
MVERSVADILEDWRACERLLDVPMATAARIELDRRIAELTDEHRAAVDSQAAYATSLGRSPEAILNGPTAAGAGRASTAD